MPRELQCKGPHPSQPCVSAMTDPCTPQQATPATFTPPPHVHAANAWHGGSLRHSLWFALPVAVVARHSWCGGLVFAAWAAFCAWLGGTLEAPAPMAGIWIAVLWALSKLVLVATWSHWWWPQGRRRP